MASTKYVILAALIGMTAAASMKGMIDEEKAKCASGTDSMACIKVRAIRFLDTIMSKDSFKISNVEVRANGFSNENKGRSQGADLIDTVQNYIQGHDVTFDIPAGDAKVTVSSRNLNNDELNLNLKLSGGESSAVEGKGKKHRLRKVAVPIMVLILLKAMTLIPMAIGILKLKAFNALALGFFSFVVSVGLAIFQLCKKIAAEHHPAHITAHGPWDGRSAPVEQYAQIESAQNLAYNAYA